MQRIIFMGTPEYSKLYLEGLIMSGITPIAVFTQPDRFVGRTQKKEFSPVKKSAETHGIPVYQPEDIREPRWTQTIHSLAPDCIVVVAFGQIIPQSILDIPPKGCVNVHPSLLPRHRGATPHQETILRGDTQTGVTIMLMDAKMDHGPILAQKKCAISPNETLETLQQKTATIGIPLLSETIHGLLDGAITPKEQHHDEATYTRILTKESGKIDWSKNAQDIERMIHALNPWPSTWTLWRNKRIKILSAHVSKKIEEHSSLLDEPFFSIANNLYTKCGESTYLEITMLQVEGKNAMIGAAFIHGYLSRKR